MSDLEKRIKSAERALQDRCAECDINEDGDNSECKNLKCSSFLHSKNLISGDFPISNADVFHWWEKNKDNYYSFNEFIATCRGKILLGQTI